MKRKFLATWEGPINGYAVNYVNANLWRLYNRYNFDELVNEAFLVYCKVSITYANKVDNPKWFMALYKTALSNRMHDLSKTINQLVEDCEEPYKGSSLVTSNDGYLEVLLNQAPSEISSVLSLFINAPQELLDLAFSSWKSNGGKKITGNRFLSSVLGLKDTRDMCKMVTDYLIKD